ncbi:hypothetical protein C2129_24205 [Escherichia coli]|nr:hypothetical protein C2129_24205 [Escherichia coli]
MDPALMQFLRVCCLSRHGQQNDGTDSDGSGSGDLFGDNSQHSLAPQVTLSFSVTLLMQHFY